MVFYLIHHQLNYFVLIVAAVVVAVVVVVVAVVGKSFASDYSENCCSCEIGSSYLSIAVELAVCSVLIEYLPNAVFGADFRANLQLQSEANENFKF